MTRLLLLAALVCACDQAGDMLPIQPGGPGSGATGFVDAAVVVDASVQILGRVCLLADPRQPTTCASTGAENLLVTLGSEQATTIGDGSFAIMRPTGANLLWSVTGAGIEPSSLRFDGSATIPAISSAVYGDMVVVMNALVLTDTGAIIAQLTRDNAPVAGASVVASPLPQSDIYYDGAGIADWNIDTMTGAFGVVWISAIAAGTASLTFDTGATAPTTVSGITVLAGTITFVFAEIP